MAILTGDSGAAHGAAQTLRDAARVAVVAAVGRSSKVDEMKLRTLVWREVFERRSQLATSFLAILLGIAAIVAVRNVTFFSEKAVAHEMDALGANILILPKGASVQDYYSADMQVEEFPEEYVDRLAMSDLEGLDNLSPKLSTRVDLGGREFVLTGILPKSEFQAKAAWRGTRS